MATAGCTEHGNASGSVPASAITAQMCGRQAQRLDIDCRSAVGLEESRCFTVIPKPKIHASERREGSKHVLACLAASI